MNTAGSVTLLKSVVLRTEIRALTTSPTNTAGSVTSLRLLVLSTEKGELATSPTNSAGSVVFEEAVVLSTMNVGLTASAIGGWSVAGVLVATRGSDPNSISIVSGNPSPSLSAPRMIAV